MINDDEKSAVSDAAAVQFISQRQQRRASVLL
jgi:hypothetical protein